MAPKFPSVAARNEGRFARGAVRGAGEKVKTLGRRRGNVAFGRKEARVEGLITYRNQRNYVQRHNELIMRVIEDYSNVLSLR